MALPFALHNLLHSAYLKSTNIGKTCLNAPISLGRATAIAFLIEFKGKKFKLFCASYYVVIYVTEDIRAHIS